MDEETCEFCGSARLEWRKCKQICRDCGNINRSCADLADSNARPLHRIV